MPCPFSVLTLPIGARGIISSDWDFFPALIWERSITIPSSHVALPAMLCPPPRTANKSPFSRAKFTARTTSDVYYQSISHGLSAAANSPSKQSRKKGARVLPGLCVGTKEFFVESRLR